MSVLCRLTYFSSVRIIMHQLFALMNVSQSVNDVDTGASFWHHLYLVSLTTTREYNQVIDNQLTSVVACEGSVNRHKGKKGTNKGFCCYCCFLLQKMVLVFISMLFLC